MSSGWAQENPPDYPQYLRNVESNSIPRRGALMDAPIHLQPVYLPASRRTGHHPSSLTVFFGHTHQIGLKKNPHCGASHGHHAAVDEGGGGAEGQETG